jgi:hypothetical protein
MTDPDEPIFRRSPRPGSRPKPENFDLPGRIRSLVTEQPFAVLCTQGEGQPYGSLVAFAFSERLDQVVFSTLVTTRKYRLLSACDHISLVIDNRPDHTQDMMQVEGLTLTGRAVEMDRGPEFDRWAALLLARHPYLDSFLAASSCALFRVDVVRGFHVTRFQEVREWRPNAGS